MNRVARAALAKETLAILTAGEYRLGDGRIVTIADAVKTCVDATQLFRPPDLAQALEQVLSRPTEMSPGTIQIENESTLAGIANLLRDGSEPVAALNFASAKNPGGGFLTGSQAQEESLARSSALHASLMNAWEFYEQHRQDSSPLYSDSIILSPNCPVFRDDAGNLLSAVHYTTFISAAAPNAGALSDTRSNDLYRVPEVFERRAEYVLAVAALQGYRHVVLGAWGCGVFRNDPRMVASVFMKLLHSSRWKNRFSRVIFSILDPSPQQALVQMFKNIAIE